MYTEYSHLLVNLEALPLDVVPDFIVEVKLCKELYS